ncbi:MAG: hypothetical protein CMH63_02075 [Nanoarchaeota archaeon]|nr:hypothetical protein [Nanoarchaeota archaeon]|tara:strand:+ start:29148 stop:29399 length:252 start_codon:yes stop_codon:yes gene_type:complete
MKNNYLSKIKRTLTSLLPVTKNREGNCKNCGACCQLPNKCSFLRFKNKTSYCIIHPFRPLNCRKYPRTEKEFLTQKTCGHKFK